MYLGRKETGKGVHLLIDNFLEAKEVNPKLKDLKLIIVGGGSFDDLHRPEALKNPDILDISNVSEEDKRALLANAVALPLKNKLEVRSQDEITKMNIMIAGTLGIVAGENPRLIKEKLIAFLPPADRLAMEEESNAA